MCLGHCIANTGDIDLVFIEMSAPLPGSLTELPGDAHPLSILAFRLRRGRNTEGEFRHAAGIEPQAGHGYFARHSTIANNVELGTQLSSFLGAASATGLGKETEASGCSEACCREQPDKRIPTMTTKRIRFRHPLQNPP
jgi:hypothetical protein